MRRTMMRLCRLVRGRGAGGGRGRRGLGLVLVLVREGVREEGVREEEEGLGGERGIRLGLCLLS